MQEARERPCDGFLCEHNLHFSDFQSCYSLATFSNGAKIQNKAFVIRQQLIWDVIYIVTYKAALCLIFQIVLLLEEIDDVAYWKSITFELYLDNNILLFLSQNKKQVTSYEPLYHNPSHHRKEYCPISSLPLFSLHQNLNHRRIMGIMHYSSPSVVQWHILDRLYIASQVITQRRSKSIKGEKCLVSNDIALFHFPFTCVIYLGTLLFWFSIIRSDMLILW